MSIAFQQVDKIQLDAAAASAAQTIRDGLIAAKRLKQLVDLKNDDALTALGYSADDMYLLRLIVQDLYDLGEVALGNQQVATERNFLVYSNSILGLH